VCVCVCVGVWVWVCVWVLDTCHWHLHHHPSNKTLRTKGASSSLGVCVRVWLRLLAAAQVEDISCSLAHLCPCVGACTVWDG
jgi:hypothetical protein